MAENATPGGVSLLVDFRMRRGSSVQHFVEC